jgi:uncharacterized RDD family membrane protein YckC
VNRDLPYAGFWIRLAARSIDIVLLIGIFNLFFVVDRLVADAGFWDPPWTAEGLSDLEPGRISYADILRGVFFFGFPVFYYTYLHGAYGQTFGKMALRIKVLTADGAPLDYRKAFLRWLGSLVCNLTLDLGYLWVAFDARKQGLHDKLCRTIVVRTDGNPPRA